MLSLVGPDVIHSFALLTHMRKLCSEGLESVAQATQLGLGQALDSLPSAHLRSHGKRAWL